MRKHVVLTAVGLGLGLLMLAWLRPETSAGATFILVAALIAVNALGVVLPPIVRAGSRMIATPGRRRRQPAGGRSPRGSP